MSMTAAEFRALALSMPEAEEGEHMGHPDFRVRSKIFAALDVDEQVAMLKLTPDQQEALMEEGGEEYWPAAGAWGRRGATHALLARAKKATLRDAVRLAWANVAPKSLRDGG